MVEHLQLQQLQLFTPARERGATAVCVCVCVCACVCVCDGADGLVESMSVSG